VIEASQGGDDTFNGASAVQQSFTVGKAMLTATADSQSIVFGDAIPELTYSYNGFVNEEGSAVLTEAPTASTNAHSESNADQYSITMSGGLADNYAFDLVNGVLTISQATAAIVISDLEYAEDGTAKEVTVTVTPAELSFTVTYNGSTDAPSAVGEYAVVVTINDVNYLGTAEATMVINNVLATAPSLAAMINVYPNPATDRLNISWGELQNGVARLFNLEGQLVGEIIKENSSHMDVSRLENGVYIMTIYNNNSLVKNQKIIIRN
jgi:hypothetical protein